MAPCSKYHFQGLPISFWVNNFFIHLTFNSIMLYQYIPGTIPSCICYHIFIIYSYIHIHPMNSWFWFSFICQLSVTCSFITSNSSAHRVLCLRQNLEYVLEVMGIYIRLQVVFRYEPTRGTILRWSKILSRKDLRDHWLWKLFLLSAISHMQRQLGVSPVPALQCVYVISCDMYM